MKATPTTQPVTPGAHPTTPVTRLRRNTATNRRPTPDPALCDDVIQQLFAIGLAMRTTQQHCTDQPAVAARIAEHMNHLQHLIQQIRSTALVTPGHPASSPPGKLIARTGGHRNGHREWPRRSAPLPHFPAPTMTRRPARCGRRRVSRGGSGTEEGTTATTAAEATAPKHPPKTGHPSRPF